MKRRNAKRMLLGAFFLFILWSVLGSRSVGRPTETAAAQGLDGRAVTIRKTYTLSGQPVAQRTVEIDANGVIQSETLHTIYTDHLGSATALMDEPGNVVATQRFFPFGEHQSDPTPLTDRGFTGHLHNDDLGLIYMNARYYLPGVGRMLTPDTIVPEPANPQSWNRYSYVHNSPLNYNDPSGHYRKPFCLSSCESNYLWDLAGFQEAELKDWDSDLINGVRNYVVNSVCSTVLLSSCKVENNAVVATTAAEQEVESLYGSIATMAGGVRVTSFENLQRKYSRHVKRQKEWGEEGITIEEYEFRAYSIFNDEATGGEGIHTFTSKDGNVFRYNKETNEFGIAWSDGNIATFFKPRDGWDYWLEQVEKYAPKD